MLLVVLILKSIGISVRILNCIVLVYKKYYSQSRPHYNFRVLVQWRRHRVRAT